MKTIHWVGALLVGLPLALPAQSDLTATAAKRTWSSDYAISERGLDHRIWSRTEEEPGPFGQTVTRVHSYVELATGLHHLGPNGQLLESKSEFEITPEGYAVARQGQHQVIVSPILNNAAGAVDLLAPDGQRMRSTILGLALRDRVTGKSVLVAQIKEGIVGRQVSPTEILFEDCSDALPFDVRMVYEIGGFHQDVLLKRAPDAAWLEANGFNPESTTLEIWTEFFEAATPRIKQQIVSQVQDAGLRQLMAEPDVVEDHLDFGAVSIPMGRAYGRKAGKGEERSVQVPKRWYEIEGRRFLVESVALSDLESLLASLPTWRPEAGEARSLQAGRRPPAPVLRRPEGQKMMAADPRGGTRRVGELAALSRDPATGAGVVLDYTLTLNGNLTNYTFKGDATYYVSGIVYLYGTNVVEGGAVFKFASGVSGRLLVYGRMVWETEAYRPAIFTAKDDNSVGEDISGSTGSPSGYYAYVGVQYASPVAPVEVKYAQVRHATYGIVISSGGAQTHAVRHSQFWNVGTSVYLTSTTGMLQNLLIYRAGTYAVYGSGSTIQAEHLTIHQAARPFYAGTVSATNSLFVWVTNWPTAFTSVNNVTNDDSSTFQTAGGGSHYLAASSPHRNAGTTNINADLAAALQAKTTYPPIVYSGATITTDGDLGVQAQRDTDAPDLGYHYDAMDYLFGGSDVNANVTFTPGTVVGWFRLTSGWYHAGHGIHIGDNKVLNFDGRANDPCWWVHQTVAQEQLVGYTPYSAGPGGITGWPVDATNSPVLNLQFTKCSGLSNFRNYFRDDYGVLKVNASHCEFYVGGLGGYISTVALTNCLMDRTYFWLDGGVLDNSVALRNCTWRGGVLSINRWSGNDHLTPVSIRDCAFDGTTVSTADAHYTNPAITDYDYNAMQSTNRTTPTGANDVLITNFNWQASSLGSFYVPTNSPLVNTGSLASAASAGLYHFTMFTNQVKETTTRLDIGYHYVACTNGVPVDTDEDGTADYVEDANGDGAVSSGETSWQSASDQGLKVLITRPKNNAVVP